MILNLLENVVMKDTMLLAPFHQQKRGKSVEQKKNLCNNPVVRIHNPVKLETIYCMHSQDN